MMKAFVREKYGSAEELQLKEIAKPVPKANEVLVKIKAVSINASDIENMTGTPYYIRAWGLFKPRYKVLGSDIAGIVEAVGSAIKTLQPGDAVYGDALYHWGGFAEYACLPETVLFRKPEALTFEQAATLPQAAVVAYQGLAYKHKLFTGSKIAINGAGGGAGTFAIQLAKKAGAEVTAIDRGDKLDVLKKLGADYTIDYAKEDFTRKEGYFDLILDLVFAHSVFDYRRALKPDGVYGMVGGKTKNVFSTILLGGLLSMLDRKKLGLISIKANEGLQEVAQWAIAGKVKPVIEKQFTFKEIPAAMQHQQAGNTIGKLVIGF